jgi:hypothetical protein
MGYSLSESATRKHDVWILIGGHVDISQWVKELEMFME